MMQEKQGHNCPHQFGFIFLSVHALSQFLFSLSPRFTNVKLYYKIIMVSFFFFSTSHNLALLSFHGGLLTTQLERLITFSHTSPLISLLG